MSQLARFSNLDTDVTLAGNSDEAVASQKAIKAYADSLAGALNAVTYKGAIDCSTNPNYPAADAGDLYVISVAGKIGGASGVTVEAGDMSICKTDGTATGTQAQRGTAWNIIQVNLGAPEAFIADPTGGATVDAEARTAIASINALLIAKGLMAAS